jgi:hypothetical protein
VKIRKDLERRILFRHALIVNIFSAAEAKVVRFCRPLRGLDSFSFVDPSAEALGYYQTSPDGDESSGIYRQGKNANSTSRITSNGEVIDE